MKVVLAYSGGLDTSVILHWIKSTYDAEVVTYTANVGQGEDELEQVESAAMETGASEAIVEDLREEFVRECIFPALRANAVPIRYDPSYTALALRAGKTASLTNSSRRSSTTASLAPVRSAAQRACSTSSAPCPTSAE